MHNDFDKSLYGVAVQPQAIGTTPVAGESIVLPWEDGRILEFTWIGGASAGADAITVNVRMRRKGTTTWDNVKESDGTTDLEFTIAEMSDGGSIDGGALRGTLDLTRLQRPNTAYEYDAIHLYAVNANNTSPGIVGCVYQIKDLYHEGDAASADDLYFKQLPYSAA